MTPDLIRMIERLLVVIFGGMSIFLGYRLFCLLPFEKSSEGKFRLPGGTAVYLTKVGPGVFFALFGAVILSVSLHETIEYKAGAGPEFVGIDGGSIRLNSSGRSAVPDSGELRSLILKLNTVPDFLSPGLDSLQKKSLHGVIDRTKLRLMRCVWSANWGSYDGFERYILSGGQHGEPKEFENAFAFFGVRSPIQSAP